jgi:hypothetical protein
MSYEENGGAREGETARNCSKVGAAGAGMIGEDMRGASSAAA